MKELTSSAQNVEAVDVSFSALQERTSAPDDVPINPLSTRYEGKGKGEPLYIPIWFEGVDVPQFALFDTGAVVSLIPNGVVNFLRLAEL